MTDLHLTTEDMMDAACEVVTLACRMDIDYRDNVALQRMADRIQVRIACNNIQQKLREFDQKMWFQGLQKQIQESKVKGVSANYNIFNVLTYSMCGRTMITFRRGKDEVTAVADQDSTESRTGLHAIDTTESEALWLIDTAIRLYQTGDLKFQDDTKLSMV